MAKKNGIKVQTQTDETVSEEKKPKNNGPQKEESSQTVDPVKALEERVESLKKEAAEKHDQLLRMAAEFENYKKRNMREMNDFRKFANESFAKAMLPVVDSLDLAVASASNDQQENNSVAEGVTMTLKELYKIFEQFGIKPIESIGKTFDPVFHQAMMQEETEAYPENTVSRELQKGYMIHDRLLRPAMVVVSKKKEASESFEKQTKNREDT